MDERQIDAMRDQKIAEYIDDGREFRTLNDAELLRRFFDCMRESFTTFAPDEKISDELLESYWGLRAEVILRRLHDIANQAMPQDLRDMVRHHAPKRIMN